MGHPAVRFIKTNLIIFIFAFKARSRANVAFDLSRQRDFTLRFENPDDTSHEIPDAEGCFHVSLFGQQEMPCFLEFNPVEVCISVADRLTQRCLGPVCYTIPFHFMPDWGRQSDMKSFSVYTTPFSFDIGLGFCLHCSGFTVCFSHPLRFLHSTSDEWEASRSYNEVQC